MARGGVNQAKQISSQKVSQLEEKISNWLGKDSKLIKNKAGDPVLISGDSKRRIRFDFNNTHGDIPHMHIEQKLNNNWKDATSVHRIYPIVD